MRSFKPYIVAIAFSLMAVSCGVDGDPGYCYISIDWEYWNEDYGVYDYTDDNLQVPDLDEIEPETYYDCYPGVYHYTYFSEDTARSYIFKGSYKLEQNPGTPAGFLHEGLDGADTYFDLFLYVKARKGLDQAGGLKSAPAEQPVATSPSAKMAVEGVERELSRSGREVHGDPLRVETREWEQTKGDWTLRVEETVRVYRK